METSLAISNFSAEVNWQLGVLSALCSNLLSCPPSHNSKIKPTVLLRICMLSIADCAHPSCCATGLCLP